jgi:hypothetical protein
MSVIDEMVRLRKEADVAYFNLPSQSLRGGTGENYDSRPSIQESNLVLPKYDVGLPPT